MKGINIIFVLLTFTGTCTCLNLNDKSANHSITLENIKNLIVHPNVSLILQNLGVGVKDVLEALENLPDLGEVSLIKALCEGYNKDSILCHGFTATAPDIQNRPRSLTAPYMIFMEYLSVLLIIAFLFYQAYKCGKRTEKSKKIEDSSKLMVVVTSGGGKKIERKSDSDAPDGHVFVDDSEGPGKGKKKNRVRHDLNKKQLHTLRTCYAANPRPCALMEEQLVEMTSLSLQVIQAWFKNKRRDYKKQKNLIKQKQGEMVSGVEKQSKDSSDTSDKGSDAVKTSEEGGQENIGSGVDSNVENVVTEEEPILNEKQLHTLRTCYAANPKPDALMQEQLVEMTSLSPRVIRVWFGNKRCKDKKKAVLMKQIKGQRKAWIQHQEQISLPLSGVVEDETGSPTDFNPTDVGTASIVESQSEEEITSNKEYDDEGCKSLWPPGIPYHGPQQCPYCPQILSNVGNWRKHVLTIHFAREKVHKCRHCNSAFRTAEYLEKHCVRVHNYPQTMTRNFLKEVSVVEKQIEGSSDKASNVVKTSEKKGGLENITSGVDSNNEDVVPEEEPVLNEKQLVKLRTCYAANPRLDALMEEQLVEMTSLSLPVIRDWFECNRCKDEKKTIHMKEIDENAKALNQQEQDIMVMNQVQVKLKQINDKLNQVQLVQVKLNQGHMNQDQLNQFQVQSKQAQVELKQVQVELNQLYVKLTQGQVKLKEEPIAESDGLE